jgi:hypothetical protein
MTGHTDPDIQAAWDDLRTGLTNMFRPHVAEISLDDLVRRAIAELIAGPGWRPPLRPAPAIIRDQRVQHSLDAS